MTKHKVKTSNEQLSRQEGGDGNKTTQLSCDKCTQCEAPDFDAEKWLEEYPDSLLLRDAIYNRAWDGLIEQQQAALLETIRQKDLLLECRNNDRRKFQSWTRIQDGIDEPSTGVIPRLMSTLTLGATSGDGHLAPGFDGTPEECLVGVDAHVVPLTREVYRLTLPKMKLKASCGSLGSSAISGSWYNTVYEESTTLWSTISGLEDDHLIIGRSGEASIHRVCFSVPNEDDFAHVAGSICLKYPFSRGLALCDQGATLICGVRKKNGVGICIIDVIADAEICCSGGAVASEAEVVCCGQCDSLYFSFHEDATLAHWNRAGQLLYKQCLGYRNSKAVKCAIYISAIRMLLVVYQEIPSCLVAWKLCGKKCKFSSCIRLRHEIKGMTLAEQMGSKRPQTLCLSTVDGQYIVLMPLQMLQRHSDIRDMDALCLDSAASHPEVAELLYNYNGIGVCATINTETGISIWTLEGGELVSRIPPAMLSSQASSDGAQFLRRRSPSNFQSMITSSLKTTGATIATMMNHERFMPRRWPSSSSTAAAANNECPDIAGFADLQWFEIAGRWYLAAFLGTSSVSVLDPIDL